MRKGGLRNFRAISPVLSVLMMIAIAVTASLVVYAWSMGYLNATTNKTGKAILIQSAKIGTDNSLLVYIQNVGTSSVQFNPDQCLYINDNLKACSLEGNNPLDQGKTVTLEIVNPGQLNSPFKIKVVTVEGTAIESKVFGQQSDLVLPVFGDGDFETGDFSQWDGTSGSLTVQGSVVHQGIYAMSYTGSSNVYAVKNLGDDYNTVFLRAYVRFGSLPATWNPFAFLCTRDSSYGTGVDAIIYSDGGTTKFGISASSGYILSSLVVETDKWYCVELRRTAGSGNGVATLWVDGNQVATTSTETLNAARYVYCGSIFSGTSCTAYIDDVVVAEAYIGT